MAYVALATDYDGTLAKDGEVDPSTVRAIERFRASGRRLLLVTGRVLEELASVFSRFDLFDRIVAENGGLLHTPSTSVTRLLGPPPPKSFVTCLRERQVRPLSIGRVVVASEERYEGAIRDALRDLGLERELEFNKGSVMVLPRGISKRSGLAEALADVRIPADQVVGVGDAENDVALFAGCGFGVAVANALPALKERADWVTKGERGEGVVQLVDRMLDGGLSR